MKGKVDRFVTTLMRCALCLLMLAASFVTHAQDPAQYGTPFTGVPNRMDANIYQMNVREYTSARTIAAAKNNLQRIKDLGINVIYLMPFNTVTTDATKGADKSPYSIKDLKGVDPGLGTLQDVRDFVAQAHTLGMAVIFDFVANQTAWDHPWVTQHPDWYAKDANGAIRSPNAGTDANPFLFTDVAEINLNNAAAAAAMVDAMRYWIFAANCDGFRFDWADKSPQAFWTNTISNLRGITTHNLLLLAEGSNEGSTSGCTTCGDNQPGAHYAQGFDYIFGSNFYWNVMKKIWNSGEPVTNLDGVTNGEYNGASSTQLVARFLSCHDNYNEDGSPFSFLSGGRNAAMSAFVVGALHRGVPFIYNGIEVGNTSALPYPWRTGTINWTQDLTVYTEMQKILNFRNGSTAIKRGQPTSYTTSSNNNVIAFAKISGSEKAVVMVNVRNSAQTFTVPAGMAGSYVNPFNNNAAVTLTSGQNVSLSPYQYLVYTNANVPVVPVTGVTVSPTTLSIKVGLSSQLTATVAPANATNQAVTWTSSNTSVASVDGTGKVTGVGVGSATITVKTNDGNKTATCAVTVSAASTLTVHYYNSLSWAAVNIYWWSAQPAGVLADGSWPGVATTSEGGGWFKYTFTNVTSTNLIFNNAQTSGGQTADLNRTSAQGDGWYYNGAWYNSKPATIAVTGVTMSPTSATVSTTFQLTATVAPSNATNQNVTWSSNNTGVATVSASGLVTAVSAGTATITVTTQDGNKTATCAVTVPSTGGTYYAIKNRWKGTYLYDAGANVGYGTTIANNNYKWQKVTIDATYFWLKNLGTGEYMNIEAQNGSVQCQPGNIDWWSQQWSQDYIDGTWVRFRNRWQTGSIIHVEGQTGSAQYSGAQDGWYSAQWQLVSVSGRSEMDLGDEEESVSFEVFPNPAKGKQINVILPTLFDGEEAQITIQNINGQVALEQRMTRSGTITHDLAAGLHIVRVRTRTASVAKKIMIEQ